jgi:hypothetical protein
MHARLKALLLRRQPAQGALPLPDGSKGEVDAACKDLGERLSDAIASCDPDPREAERLRLQYLKERS